MDAEEISVSQAQSARNPTNDMPRLQIHGAGVVRLDRVPQPGVGEHDLLVEVRQCGLCGSDLGYIAMGGLLSPLAPGAVLPIGHELSGVIARAGAEVRHVAVGDRVVVFGAGPIGLGIVLVLRHYGIDCISVVDRSARRLEIARKIGAQTCPAGRDLAKTLLAQQGAADFWGSPVPAADLYIEATGVGAVFGQAVQLAKAGARLVVVGVHKAPVELDLVTVLMKEISIVGSMAYPDEFPQVIRMLESGRVDAKALVSHRFALSDFANALATARDQEQAVKVLVDCQR